MIESEKNNKKEVTNEQMNKQNLENIVFSQILANMTSMKDFKIDIRIILKIIDELIKKYSSDKKPDEEIKYEIYNPKIDIKNCYKDDEFKLYYNTIFTMK